MYCLNCGCFNPEEATFCNACGKSLTLISSEPTTIHESTEQEIRAGAANHFMGSEGVGGKLFLTNKRLRFKSHSINIQVHEMSIPLKQIVKIEKVRGLLAFTQIQIFLKDGTIEKFVVYNRDEWIKDIMAQACKCY